MKQERQRGLVLVRSYGALLVEEGNLVRLGTMTVHFEDRLGLLHVYGYSCIALLAHVVGKTDEATGAVAVRAPHCADCDISSQTLALNIGMKLCTMVVIYQQAIQANSPWMGKTHSVTPAISRLPRTSEH